MSTTPLSTSAKDRWSFIASMKLNWIILRICIEEKLIYRGDFVFATLIRFLPIVTQIFLWGAIFAVGTENERGNLNGYSYQDMVSYYLLVMVTRAFSSMPSLAGGIARNIRDGELKKYLTQPIDYIGYLFWHRVAHKLVYYLVAAGPFALVFFLCRSYLPFYPGEWVIAAFIASLAMAFLIGFLIESTIGMIGFWFLEVSSLLFIYMMMNYFLSGHMVPLDWLPHQVQNAIQYLPFKYLAYFPAAIILGKIPPDQIGGEIAIEFAWVIGLLVVNRIVFYRGVRRYSAFGG